MPITTSMGGYYKDEMEWHRDQVFPKSTDPQMNIDADQFLNDRMNTEEPSLDLGLPPEDQTNPLNDVVSDNPQPTLVSGKDIKPIQIPVRGNLSLQRAIENAEGDDDLRDLKNRLQKRGINTDAIPAFQDLK